MDRAETMTAVDHAELKRLAEGAGDDWGRYARAICESEGKQWMGLDNSRADCERWFAAGRAIAALRNRTSEPEVTFAPDVEELKADCTRSLPSGLDDSTYEKIEDALDRADAPMTADGKWLTLAQRVDAFHARSDEVREAIVTAIAFLNRDQGTDRIDGTISALMPKLVRADAIMRGEV